MMDPADFTLPPAAGDPTAGGEGCRPDRAGRQPGGQTVPDWGSLWRLLVVQTQNAFNDKVAQFTLLGLAKVWLDRAASDRYAHIVSVLLVVPLLFFAPVAGWMSDRFSKSRVVLWSSMAQAVLLAAIAGAFYLEWFWTATGLFFLLALQAALLQPAKGGVVKEYVGERYLALASGWVQMSAILAFVIGQWVGGRMFEYFYENGAAGDGGLAACWTALLMAGGALGMVWFSLTMRPTEAHTDEPFRLSLFTRHFHHLGDLLRIRKIRLTSLGVSFFWFSATLLTLMLIQVATETEPNEASQAERSGMLMSFVGAGVAAGCVLTAWLSSGRIELGLVPLGGLGMAAASAGVLLADAGDNWVFRGLIFAIGASSAVFLVPLNAYLQDQLEPRVRGRMLSAAGLLDALAMLAAIAVQYVLMKLEVPVAWQFVLMGLLCLATAVYVLRIIPQSFLRFTVLGLVRVIYRTRSLHAGRLPEKGGALLICNHVSYVDALVLSAACDREVVFTVYDGFFKNPLLARFMRLFGVVPISEKRAKDAILTMAETIRAGHLVCIFPEGQLTRTGFMNEVRKGFELIARKAGAPVVPVYLDALWGSIFSFERGRFFLKRPQRFPVHLTAVWGEPVPAERVSAEAARRAFRRLAEEGLMARPEVRRSLRLALVEGLCHAPWRLAVADAEGPQDPGRRLSRGTLFAQAMHLARRWEPLAMGRVLVVLPDHSTAAVLAVLALKFAGKIPVLLPPALLAPAAERSGAVLAAFLEEHGLRSVVSHAGMRAACPEAPWPDHFLDLQAEMEGLDDLLVLVDFAFAALAPESLRRLRTEWRAGQDGLGWIRRLPEEEHRHGPAVSGGSSAAGLPETPSPATPASSSAFSLVLKTDHDLLAQVEQLRGTDLLRAGDTLLTDFPLASAGGQVLLWSALVRGLPLVLAPESAAPGAGTAWLAEYSPTLGAGSPALASALDAAAAATGLPPARAFLHWTPYGGGSGSGCLVPRPEACSSLPGRPPAAAPGMVPCPGLVDEESGRLLAVSLPDPPLGSRTAEPQTGRLPGSPGRLLPGLGPEGLPPGWRLEDSGYLLPGLPPAG